MTRRLLAGVLAGLLAGLLTLVAQAPAAAHARLVSTDPVNGAVLPQAPDRVTLTFSEPVRLTARRITVHDARAGLVASTSTATDDGVVTTRFDEGLERGTYVVGWSVVSADGHPISGSLTFSVGERSAEVVQPPPPPESPAAVTAVRAVLTAVGYLGLLVAAGLAAYVVLVLPGDQSHRTLRRRIRTLVRVATAVALLAAVLAVPVTAAYAQGLELADVAGGFDPALVDAETRALVALVLGLGVVVAALGERPPGPDRRTALLAGAGLAVVSPSIAGHTRAYGPGWLVLGADSAHLAAGALWLGGLVGLALTLRAHRDRPEQAGAVLARFSMLAGGALVVVAAAGVLLAWRILGSWEGLVSTAYGRLLLAKVGLALLAAALGAWNRYGLLPRLRGTARDHAAPARLLRRTVGVEVLLLAVLVGVTSLLVAEPPVATPAGATAPEPVVRTVELGELDVTVRLAPGVQGGNTLEVAVTDADGRPVAPPERPRVELRTEEFDLGAVPLRESASGAPGRYDAQVLLPRPGEWELQVALRLGRFEASVATVAFEVPGLG